jgi:valyl-tRNA synthetase
MDWLVKLISAIRAVRAEMNVPVAARVSLLIKGASPETRTRLATHGDIITTMVRAAGLQLVEDAPAKGTIQVVVDEAVVVLPLADIIDLARESARLSKEVGKLTVEIDKVDKKLSNPSFVAKAPPEVVEEQRERRDEWCAIRDRLTEALRRLEGAEA